VIGAWLEPPAIAATLTPAPAVHDIDWRTSPLDLNLRGLNGERFRFNCPSGKAKAGQVVGKGPYTDGSSICAAAVHAGVIHAASGGLVTIEVRPGEAHYEASWSHFIQSESYERFWRGHERVLQQTDLFDRGTLKHRESHHENDFASLLNARITCRVGARSR
jgi:LCCL domain